MNITRIILTSFFLSIMLLSYQTGQSRANTQPFNLNPSISDHSLDLDSKMNPLPISSKANSIATALTTQTGSCHFGITVPLGANGYDLSILGVDSYLDWQGDVKNSSVADNIQYIRVLRVSDAQFASQLAALPAHLLAYPGSTWIIGNEPDAEVKHQDNITAESYANRFYQMATLIRTTDSSATIAFGAILQPTPVRLEYLNRVIANLTTLAGSLQNALSLIDIYAIHAFSLPEDPLYDSNGNPIPNTWGAGVPLGYDPSTWPDYYHWQDNADVIDMNIFTSRITAFRQWMKDQGPLERGKQLWITEYGSLFKVPTMSELTSAQYMEETFNYLLGATNVDLGDPNDNNLLVQKWMWYSLNDSILFGGSLYDSTTHQMTVVGDHFINYNPSTSLVPVTNPDVYVDPNSLTITPGLPGKYKVTVKVGNLKSTDRLTGVKFELLNGAQVVGTIDTNIPRCAGRLPISFEFSNLVAGQSYTFKARVSLLVGNGTDTDLANNEFSFPPSTMPTLHNVMIPVVAK